MDTSLELDSTPLTIVATTLFSLSPFNVSFFSREEKVGRSREGGQGRANELSCADVSFPSDSQIC